MEKNNLKALITDFEDLSGKFKDAKDFNSVITNILKKKNAKNKIEILINFLDNLTLIKEELKSYKKLEKTIFSILQSENGEERFLKEFLSKLEDRSCTTILNPLRENLNKFSKFKNLISQRINVENNYFLERFGNQKSYKDLITSMMNSDFIEENLFYHFFNFWNNLPKQEINIKNNSNILIFDYLNNFKQSFLETIKQLIDERSYSKIFFEEMFKNRKIPNEFEIFIEEKNLVNRLKIDEFLQEFNKTKNFSEFITEIFEKKAKIYLFYEFLNQIEKFKNNYNSENFSKTIFEIIFKEKGLEKFYLVFVEEFFQNAYCLYKKCKQTFTSIRIYFSDNPHFIKGISINKTVTKLKHQTILKFLESIKGSTYGIIAENLLNFSFDEKNIEVILYFLESQLNIEILNLIVIDDSYNKFHPLNDIYNGSKETFINSIIKEIIINKNFKKQKIVLLTIIYEILKKSIPQDDLIHINLLKEQYLAFEKKKFKYIYSRFLAYEIDVYYLLDFIPKYDYEKLSLLVNRLIRSFRYQDAMIVLKLNNFDKKIHIEVEYQKDLFLSFKQINFKPKERKIFYVEKEDNFNDFEEKNN